MNRLDSKSVQLGVTIPQYQTATMRCPGDNSLLTITKAMYGSNQQPNCTADVRDVMTKICNITTNSKMCTFPVLNEQLEVDPCFGQPKNISINYICTQSGK